MRRMKAHRVCGSTCLFLCSCVLCIFVRSPGISHPAAYQSRPLCSSVCISVFPLSSILGLIHASAGQREGLWHSEANVTAVTSETDTLPPTDTGRAARSKRGGCRERQGDKVSLKICRP